MTHHDTIRDSFARQGMMHTLGATLEKLGEGTAEIHAPILPGSTQHLGYGHAGLTFSIGDSAAGYAAQTLMAQDQVVMTTEIKINLLAPAKGDKLIARGRVVKPGRRLMVVMSEVFAVENGVEKQIALLTGTMIPV